MEHLTPSDVGLAYQTHRISIKSYLLKRGCPFERNDDLLHEVLLKLLKRMDKTQVQSVQIPALLYWMAGDLLHDQVYRKKQPLSLGAEEIPAPAPKPNVAEAFLEILENAVCDTRLTPPQRRILDLRFFAEQPVREIATELAVSASTIFRQWRRIKAYLKERLVEQGMNGELL